MMQSALQRATGHVDTRGVSRKEYRPPVAIAIKGVGVGGTGLGLAVVAVSVVAAVGMPGWLRTALIAMLAIVAVGSLVILTVGALRALGWGARLVIDDDGFLNATGPRPGARRIVWRDVRKVQADGSVVSVDVAGGRQTVVRTSALNVEPRELARELRSRLNTDRGLEPVRSTRRKPVSGQGA